MKVSTNNNLQCTIAMAALQHVTDPEIGLSIVDLGLIYKIDFDSEHQTMEVLMTLTTEFCPMGETIANNAKIALEAAFPRYSINILLTFDPPWSYDRISEEGKNFLKRS